VIVVCDVPGLDLTARPVVCLQYTAFGTGCTPLL